MGGKEGYYCQFCGLDRKEFVWDEATNTPSFTIYDCCGVEFGYQDKLIHAIRQYRKKWFDKGAKWHEPKYQPEGWKLSEQLEQIPARHL